MSTSRAPAIPEPPEPPVLRRATSSKALGGVAAGIADHLKLPVLWVRGSFIALALLDGLGFVLYGLLWVLVPASSHQASAGLDMATRHGLRTPARVASDRGAVLSASLLAIGVGWLLASAGGFVPTRIFWPMVIGGAGVVTIWSQADRATDPDPEADRQGFWSSVARGRGVGSLIRLAGGLLLTGAGTSWLLATQIGFAQLPPVLAAAAILLAGLLLVSAPWLHQLQTRVREADQERLRAEERADMAAHLHDSVLQTLALIQRQASDPTTVANLARRQERELRTWLYGEPTRAQSLKGALEEIRTEAETRFAIPVEVVCVGDIDLDEDTRALVQAAGEAVTNAGKHSGADRIDVYAEVDQEVIEVFVRDRGDGFDQAFVPEDRRGVRESIHARMERHGGRAVIRSEPGEGTEVRLEMRR